MEITSSALSQVSMVSPDGEVSWVSVSTGPNGTRVDGSHIDKGNTAAADGGSSGFQKPTIGRIVYYHEAGFIEVPAIITRVWDMTTVDLTVFILNGPPISRTMVSMVDHEVNPELAATHSAMWRWPPRS